MFDVPMRSMNTRITYYGKARAFDVRVHLAAYLACKCSIVKSNPSRRASAACADINERETSQLCMFIVRGNFLRFGWRCTIALSRFIVSLPLRLTSTQPDGSTRAFYTRNNPLPEGVYMPVCGTPLGREVDERERRRVSLAGWSRVEPGLSPNNLNNFTMARAPFARRSRNKLRSRNFKIDDRTAATAILLPGLRT